MAAAGGVGESGLLVASGGAGSVDGVRPLWGFTLRFKGLATKPLPFDASADEEQALEALPSVGVASASSSLQAGLSVATPPASPEAPEVKNPIKSIKKV